MSRFPKTKIPTIQQHSSECKFDARTFLDEGKDKGYAIYASDGKPFLVKYSDPIFDEGRLRSLTIWLVDPFVSQNDMAGPSHISEMFSHFFAQDKSNSEHYLGIDDSGVIVAEIVLIVDESELLYLIDDLNYKHITDSVLGEYYSSYKGRYDYIGRSMVGIAGRVLNNIYGIGALGVKTDKTRGFYWEILGHPLKKPIIPLMAKQLNLIRDLKIRKEIREELYINIIKNIAHHRFDPYICFGEGLGIEYAWESHCNEIQGILLDNKSLIGRLLGQSMDSISTIMGEDLADFIDQMMTDYCAENFDWFNSISERVQNLKDAQDSNDKERATVIIDEIIYIEEDAIIKKALNNLKRPEIRKDFMTTIHETISQYYRIFPIFDLSKIDEIKIGIVLHEKISG